MYVVEVFRTRDALCQETVFGFSLSRPFGQVFLLPSFHRQSLDLVSLGQHRVLSSEVHIRRRHVVKRFVITLVVVVRDEVPQGRFQLPGKVVVLLVSPFILVPASELAFAEGNWRPDEAQALQ